MEDALFKMVFDNIPTIGMCIVFIGCTWWVRGVFMDFKYRLLKIESDIAQLARNQLAFDKRLTNLENRMINFENRMINLEHNFDLLITHLKATRLLDQGFLTRSPIELSDVGKSILLATGGKDYVDRNVDILVAEIEKKAFKSPLDVQHYCHRLMFNGSYADEFMPVKDYVFNHPVYKTEGQEPVALDLLLAIRIMAVYLRNQYFDRHPET